MTDEVIALIIRHTGWSLEYIRELPLIYLDALARELLYLEELDRYDRAKNSALIVCVLASSKTRHYQVKEIIGSPPERGEMSKKQLSKEPKIITVKLTDGNVWELPHLTLNVLADLEEEFDLSLEEISELMNKRQTSALRRALYVMLHRRYPDVERDQVADLVDLSNLTEVVTAVAKALGG